MQAPGQVQPGSGEGSEGSREGLGGFGAEPGHLQQGSGVPEKVWEALVQSQGSPEGSERRCGRLWCKAKSGSASADGSGRLKFNRAPKKVPGGFGAEPGQVQQGSGQGSGEEKVPEKVPGGFGAEPGQAQAQHGSGERSGEGLGGFVQCQVRFSRICGHLIHGNPAVASQHASERFVKITRCGCWGYHGSLFFTYVYKYIYIHYMLYIYIYVIYICYIYMLYIHVIYICYIYVIYMYIYTYVICMLYIHVIYIYVIYTCYLYMLCIYIYIYVTYILYIYIC